MTFALLLLDEDPAKPRPFGTLDEAKDAGLATGRPFEVHEIPAPGRTIGYRVVYP